MAFEGRSTARGRQPGWLSAINDIRFIGHSGKDDTVLRFEAPQLGDAAPMLYKQGELWETRPADTDTGFDLLCDVVTDVARQNKDSDRFDLRLLTQVADFGRALNGSFQSMAVRGGRQAVDHPAIIDHSVIECADSMSRETPPPQAVRVMGRLDMIRASTRAFAIKLPDDVDVRGVLMQGEVGKLAHLLERDVLIVGKAVFRPSGGLLRVDADAVSAARSSDECFARVPEPRLRKLDVKRELQDQRHKAGVAAILGRWPGDESSEEVEQALREMS